MRHSSLIPLSREHHYALMLCLRINRGLIAYQTDLLWLEKKTDQALRFHDTELTIHFKAEEEILFPSMKGFQSAVVVISRLIEEHRRISEIVDALRSAERSAAALLEELAVLLEAHIRKEERVLFPIYEQHVSAKVQEEVGAAIAGLIGNASTPRDPELLDP
jgi:iron-sulfur cluster repair protein YtfE (RIC family)